jgi:hypothetical protein
MGKKRNTEKDITSTCNISIDGAATRKAIVHKISNSTKIPRIDSFLSLLKAVKSSSISGCNQS